MKRNALPATITQSPAVIVALAKFIDCLSGDRCGSAGIELRYYRFVIARKQSSPP
jgi:hypothetical protein